MKMWVNQPPFTSKSFTAKPLLNSKTISTKLFFLKDVFFVNLSDPTVYTLTGF